MSIEKDIYNYVAADLTLQALLGASSFDSKIYPLIAPDTMKNSSGADVPLVAPHIVFFKPGEGSADEILDGMRIAFRITTDNYDYALATQIRDQLNILLDFKQRREKIVVPSTDNNIYYIQKNGGGEDRDDQTKQVIKIVNYDIIYTVK